MKQLLNNQSPFQTKSNHSSQDDQYGTADVEILGPARGFTIDIGNQVSQNDSTKKIDDRADPTNEINQGNLDVKFNG